MAQSMHVELYETEPATEWLLGGPVQKVSPKWAHSVLQSALASLMRAWAAGRGTVGTEWRFWLTPTGEEARYLVPDVAFVSSERFRRGATLDIGAESHFAPDVVVEILSPDDRSRFVEHKIDVYLRAGVRLVVIVDPQQRRVRAFDLRAQRTFAVGDRFAHAAMSGFAFDVAALFAELEPQ